VSSELYVVLVEVVGANKETSMKHPQGRKWCSIKEVTHPTDQMKCL